MANYETKEQQRGWQGGGTGFQTTHWTEIRRAADPARPESVAALAAVCSAYWYPAYAYVRGCGYSPEDAQDLTQGFFLGWIEREFLSAADATRGRFRWFLLAALQNFLRNEIVRSRALKRGGGVALLSWDSMEAEQRYAAEPVEASTPDLIFDRSWARVILSRALERLGREFTSSSRAVVFEHLKSCLEGSVAPQAYEEIGARLGLSPVAVKVAVHRLRERFRQLIRLEIEQTVAEPSDVEDEFRHLVHLIAG